MNKIFYRFINNFIFLFVLYVKFTITQYFVCIIGMHQVAFKSCDAFGATFNYSNLKNDAF